MKWESSDLAVGAVVVAAAVILLGSFLWLSPAVAGGTYPLYTEFDRIDGINDQSNVVLRGYTVGRVGAIEPRVGDGGLRFRVRLDIESELASGDSLLLPLGTTARLVPPPVIGAGFILLETPATVAGLLEPGSTIPGTRATAMLEQVQGITEDVSAEVVVTMDLARTLMDSVTAAIGTANRALAETSAAIPTLMRGLEAQLDATAALTADLQQQVDTLGPSTLATIDSVQLLLADSRALVRDLHGTVAVTTPEIRQILARLDTTTVLLNHFVRRVSEKPLRMLSGVDPPPGLDPPPPGPGIEPGSPADTVPTLRDDTAASAGGAAAETGGGGGP
ncbi:MAG: MlaD family protein [Longimicrobiales bacterium]|nr:MlaD family protein [Longimicrobiales bacterium]